MEQDTLESDDEYDYDDESMEPQESMSLLITLFQVIHGHFDSSQITKLLRFIARNGDDQSIPILQEIIDRGYSLNQPGLNFLSVICKPCEFSKKLVEFVLHNIDVNDSHVLFDLRSDNVDLLQLLIQFGCDPNIYDQNGKTPLHFYVQHGWINCVKFLLDHGSSPHIISQNGLEPIHYAEFKYGDEALIHLLINHGVDLYQCDPDGLTSLDRWYNLMKKKHTIPEKIIDLFLDQIGQHQPPQFLMWMICKNHPLNLPQFRKALSSGLNPTSHALGELDFADACLVVPILIEQNCYHPDDLIVKPTSISIACLIASPEMIKNVDISSETKIVLWVKKLLNLMDEIRGCKYMYSTVDVATVIFELLLIPDGRQFIDTHIKFRTVVLSKITELSAMSDRIAKFHQSYENYWAFD
jgi:hypothetical protein